MVETWKKILLDGDAEVDYPKKLQPSTARYVIPGWYVAAGGATAALTTGRIYYVPIFVSSTTTYVLAILYVNTAKTGTIDIRVFSWNNGLPGSLVASLGTVSTSTTGWKSLVISLTLSRGYYFIAFQASSNPTISGADVGSAISAPVAGSSLAQDRPAYPILYVDAAYADPAPAPTGDINAAYSCCIIFQEQD